MILGYDTGNEEPDWNPDTNWRSSIGNALHKPSHSWGSALTQVLEITRSRRLRKGSGSNKQGKEGENG